MDMNLDIDKILYADMQNALRHQAVILYEDERSLLLQDISSGLTYCTALDAEAAANMIGTLRILISSCRMMNTVIKLFSNVFTLPMKIVVTIVSILGISVFLLICQQAFTLLL